MLRSPRANLVESDEGFLVEVLGRTGILYKERDHVMFVDSEVLALRNRGMQEYNSALARAAPTRGRG